MAVPMVKMGQKESRINIELRTSDIDYAAIDVPAVKVGHDDDSETRSLGSDIESSAETVEIFAIVVVLSAIETRV